MHRVVILLSESTDKEVTDLFLALIDTFGLHSETITYIPDVSSFDHADMVFIDAGATDCCGNLPAEFKQLAEKTRVVFFNANPKKQCEKQLVLAGFNGIFYSNERPDIILKGLSHLQQKERWFKRDAMNEAITELLSGRASIIEDKDFGFLNLTKRENAIINLVSKGAKNAEIAEQLHISPNTVKTHLYSIFRKTQSRNRVELISLTQQVGNS